MVVTWLLLPPNCICILIGSAVLQNLPVCLTRTNTPKRQMLRRDRIIPKRRLFWLRYSEPYHPTLLGNPKGCKDDANGTGHPPCVMRHRSFQLTLETRLRIRLHRPQLGGTTPFWHNRDRCVSSARSARRSVCPKIFMRMQSCVLWLIERTGLEALHDTVTTRRRRYTGVVLRLPTTRPVRLFFVDGKKRKTKEAMAGHYHQ